MKVTSVCCYRSSFYVSKVPVRNWLSNVTSYACIACRWRMGLIRHQYGRRFPAKAWKRLGSTDLSDVNEDKNDVRQRHFGSSAVLPSRRDSVVTTRSSGCKVRQLLRIYCCITAAGASLARKTFRYRYRLRPSRHHD